MPESFLSRFPKYTFEAYHWKPIQLPKLDLSVLKASICLEKIEVLYVYGLHGDVFDLYKNWLSERPERRLIFLEENEQVIAAHFDHEMVKCFQVEIEWLSSIPSQVQELTRKYWAAFIEVVALPYCCQKRFQAIRLEILRKNTLYFSYFYDRLHSHKIFKNFIRNLSVLNRSFDVCSLKDQFQNIPAIICGAGPSLQEDISILKNLKNNALIFAGGSALPILKFFGMEPHFGVAIDPNMEEFERFRDRSYSCPILYSSRVYSEIFTSCKGPLGYIRSEFGGKVERWLDEKLNRKELPLCLDQHAESMSVTTVILELAHFLGCNPIILTGVDLASTNQKRYSPGIDCAETPSQLTGDYLIEQIGKDGNKVQTATRWIMEKESLSDFALRSKKKCINATRRGLSVPHFEEMTLDRISFAPINHLSNSIQAAIENANSFHFNKDQLSDLIMSLDRVIALLKLLCNPDESLKGKKMVAAIEIEDEMATQILFSDMMHILEEIDDRFCFNEKWKGWLEIACKYRKEC